MNILGYISAILILIGIAFQGYYMGWFLDKKIHDNLKGYHTAYHEIEKKYIKQKFDSIPEKKEKTKSVSIKQNSPSSKIPYKKELTPSCMRLNLWIYKDADINNSINFRVLEKLINILYGDVIIEKKRIAKFTKNLIRAIQDKKNTTVHLEQLKFNNDKDQDTFYKMLKGDKGYYPSILSYVTFKSDSNSQICIACADSVILTSLFNEQITESLIFNKSDPLQQIVIDEASFQKIISSYCVDKTHIPNFTLKHRKAILKEIIITSEDESTHIQLNQKMPLNISHAKKNS